MTFRQDQRKALNDQIMDFMMWRFDFASWDAFCRYVYKAWCEYVDRIIFMGDVHQP